METPGTTYENNGKMEQTEQEVVRADANYREMQGHFYLAAIVAAIVVIVVCVIPIYLYLAKYPTAGFIVSLVALLLSVLAVAVVILFKAFLSDAKDVFDDAKMRKNLLENQADQADSSKAFIRNLVGITLENQSKNYRLVHTQADKSFWTTLAVSVGGFVLIGLGIYFGSQDTTKAAAYVGAICGSITEFIAGVFFYLYNKTITQLREYHKSLVSLQNVLLCLQLVQQVEDVKKRNDMLSKVIDSLLTGTYVKTLVEPGQPSEELAKADAE